jgi:hypothetical protein
MKITNELLHLYKQSLVQWKFMDIPTSFIWIIVFFDGGSESDGGETSGCLRWMWNLHQSAWDHEILHADRSSKDVQLLMRLLLQRNQAVEH